MTTKKKSALIPPDLDRCQVEWKDGSFMTLGPRQWVRCDKPPTFVAKVKEPGKDGRRGSMAMCDEHRKVYEERSPGTATFHKITTRVVKRITSRTVRTVAKEAEG